MDVVGSCETLWLVKSVKCPLIALFAGVTGLIADRLDNGGDMGDGVWIGSDPAQTASTLAVTATPEWLEVGDG